MIISWSTFYSIAELRTSGNSFPLCEKMADLRDVKATESATTYSRRTRLAFRGSVVLLNN